MRMWGLAWLMVAACAPSAPEACATMCRTWVDAEATCLDEARRDWSAWGWSDGSQALAACEVWSWEAALLSEHLGDLHAAARYCAEQVGLAASANDACAWAGAVNWDGPPW